MKKQVLVFLALTFGITWSIDALLVAAHASKAALTFSRMWGPGLAAIITSIIFNRSIKQLGLAIKNKQYLLAGYSLPLVYAVPVYTAIWFFGFAPLNSGIRGIEIDYFTLFILGQIYFVLGALGEEIGWRGFLYPLLSKEKGRFNAALITGILWAAWHFPFIIKGHIQGAPVWFMLSCFSLMIISMSFITAWLRDHSKNVWPAVLLHASHNFYIQVILNNLTRPTQYREYLHGEYGIGLALSTFLVASMLWLNHEKKSLDNSTLVPA